MRKLFAEYCHSSLIIEKTYIWRLLSESFGSKKKNNKKVISALRQYILLNDYITCLIYLFLLVVSGKFPTHLSIYTFSKNKPQ